MELDFSRHIMRECSIVHRGFHRLVNRRLAKYGANTVHVHFLRKINRNPGITGAELGHFFSKDKGAVTRCISHLESKKYVEKRADKKDKRISRLYITELGKEIFHKLHMIYHETESQVLANLDEDAIAILEDSLRKISDQIKIYEEKLDDQ